MPSSPLRRGWLPSVLLPLLSTLGTVATAGQEVADRARDPASGRSYLRTPEPLTFHDAEALARAMGGALVSVETAEEETFLLENFGAEPYWIGLEFPREVWASGAAVGFTHWSPGEPTGSTDEPFTLMSWSDPGTWGDTDGDVESMRFRAIVEFPPGVVAGLTLALPPTRPTNRGVLVIAIQELTGKDLQNPRLPSLLALAKGSAWTHEAAGDGSGDPLANLGMVLWGVGSARSRLTSANPKGAARDRNSDLLARLERSIPSVSTAALLDDPALAGVLLGGRTDLRSSGASPRKGGSLEPVSDALSRPTPACVVVTYTNLSAPGGPARSEGERTKDLAAIDRELGGLLAALRARPTYAEEEWLIVLCGLSAPPAKGSKEPAEAEASTVPLVLVASPLPVGEILAQVSLVDVLPLAFRHLGLETRRAYGLDGLGPMSPTALGQEALVNGGFEAQFGWPNGAHPVTSGWRSLSGFRTARHDEASAGSPAPGTSFLQGGDAPSASLEQRIDLRALAPEIERGSVRVRFSGWLGTRAGPPVTLEASLELWSEQKKTLERVPLARLTNAKGASEGSAAGLSEFTATARVPKRTRAARLVLSASGPEGTRAAMADELSLSFERD